ncbi:cytochrome b5 type B [Anopheles darlingi]|uniref:Cytochrome b5 type B n=2 Tax=Anopheles darlingi TaxID=43151 RepID=W5JN23_ANODA|nr:cytochrome b5 type B [Anopheles darlingi]
MPSELKQYTMAEVESCDGKDGHLAWLVIRDNVYDVTRYLEEHPGSSELIEEWAGKDGTKPFEEFGHSSDALRTLRSLQIGVLEEQDQAKNRKARAAKSGIITDSTADEPKLKKRSKRRMFILCG